MLGSLLLASEFHGLATGRSSCPSGSQTTTAFSPETLGLQTSLPKRSRRFCQPSRCGTTRHFVSKVLALFATNNLDPSDIVLIMSGTMASNISMMVNALGQPDFPALSDAGGYLAGKPVIVSEHLTSLGSPSTQMIVAVKASDVYLADDGVVTVEASDQASIEMVDTSSQSGISGTGASLVSLWQSGLVGLMANREITWKLRRSTAVQYISPAAYAVPTS